MLFVISYYSVVYIDIKTLTITNLLSGDKKNPLNEGVFPKSNVVRPIERPCVSKKLVVCKAHFVRKTGIWRI